jgi:type VII secretion integral membrane protein EccD
LASVVGYAASATLLSLFTAGVAVGLTALTGSLVALPKALDATDGAAVVVAAVLLLLPLYPAFAVRAGRVPVPEPARDPRELTEDPPDPAREEILAAVARAQDILLGLLIATGLTVVAGAAFLAAAQEPGTTVLAAVAALSVLLRGRTFSTAHERLPLFAGGVGAALAALAVVAFLARAQHASGQFAGLPAAGFAGLPAAGAALAVAVGLVYSRRGPSPTLSRYGAALDMVCLVALIPLAIVPLGLYGAVGRLAGASS